MGAEGVREGDACLDAEDLGLIRGLGHLNNQPAQYDDRDVLLTVWQGEVQVYFAVADIGGKAGSNRNFGCDMRNGQLHAVNGWTVSDIRAFLNGVRVLNGNELAA